MEHRGRPVHENKVALFRAFNPRIVAITRILISTMLLTLCIGGPLGLGHASAQIIVPWQSPTGLDVPPVARFRKFRQRAVLSMLTPSTVAPAETVRRLTPGTR